MGAQWDTHTIDRIDDALLAACADGEPDMGPVSS